jgi:hypothetical protein
LIATHIKLTKEELEILYVESVRCGFTRPNETPPVSLSDKKLALKYLIRDYAAELIEKANAPKNPPKPKGKPKAAKESI